MTDPAAYRVVATDLDGTIVRSDGTISGRTRDALAAVAEAGATVVIVTGRPPRWLDGIADATGHRGLAICANGALVYDLHAESVIAASPLEPADVRAIVALLQQSIPGLAFAVESLDDGFAHEPAYRPRWSTGPKTRVAPLADLVDGPVVKLLARHPTMSPDELLARAADVVVAESATLTHSSRDGLLEISAAGITKATALAELVAAHDQTAARVIAFGDMPNDLPMLTWAGHSVAVANAHPEVIAAADEVTASNDDDGVADVLERVFGR
ncbi:MAG TPA: HAD family hydrolase [Mycobacteriales bacterium]|jgi:Cof subfamily protein (haloacid dehalogenase superfamily)|nr:HAD family hydrolase [Mycobacteriales bacterium]